MNPIEAADLARIILDDTETDRHMDLYTLTVIEARTLAHAVTRVEALADLLDAEAERVGSHGGAFTARAFASEIRNALNGDAA